MQERQQEILAKAWVGRAPDLPLATPEELLTLASIVEKETGVAEERAQVASVFENRLRQGMRLQTDPSVIYGITKGEGTLGRGLKASELAAPTPYNTYVQRRAAADADRQPGRGGDRGGGEPGDDQLPLLRRGRHRRPRLRRDAGRSTTATSRSGGGSRRSALRRRGRRRRLRLRRGRRGG